MSHPIPKETECPPTLCHFINQHFWRILYLKKGRPPQEPPHIERDPAYCGIWLSINDNKYYCQEARRATRYETQRPKRVFSVQKRSSKPGSPKNYNKSNELLTSFSTLEPVFPSKSSGPLAQPVVSDLFFNIAKYIFHFGLIIYYTTCCGGSMAKADYIKKGTRL